MKELCISLMLIEPYSKVVLQYRGFAPQYSYILYFYSYNYFPKLGQVKYSITDNFQKLILELFNAFLSSMLACTTRNYLSFTKGNYFYDQLNFGHSRTHITMAN